MEFYNLRKSINLNTRRFCKAVYNIAYEHRREPSGLDVDTVVPELERMKDRLSYYILNYDLKTGGEIVEAIKEAHLLKGLYVIFPYKTCNYDYVVKRAYESGDLREHLCFCYNKICEYEEYLMAA